MTHPLKNGYRVLGTVVTVAAGMLFALFLYARSIEPNYVSAAEIQHFPETIVRLRATNEFSSAVAALQSRGYGEAISRLRTDLKKNPLAASLSAVHLMLGWAYVQSSISKKFLVFPAIDENKVNLAVHQFSLALKKNSLLQNGSVISNACYFLAVAYLLKEDKVTAAQYLNIVILQKGEMASKAKELLSRIQRAE